MPLLELDLVRRIILLCNVPWRVLTASMGALFQCSVGNKRERPDRTSTVAVYDNADATRGAKRRVTLPTSPTERTIPPVVVCGRSRADPGLPVSPIPHTPAAVVTSHGAEMLRSKSEAALSETPPLWLRSGRTFAHALVREAATIQVQSLSAFQFAPVTEPSLPSIPYIIIRTNDTPMTTTMKR